MIPAKDYNLELLESYYKTLRVAKAKLEEINMFHDHDRFKVHKLLKRNKNILHQKYKASALLRGEVKSGKSSVLSAILKDHLSPISSAPETLHLIAIQYDKQHVEPALFQAKLKSAYKKDHGYFCMKDKYLSACKAKGTPAIFEFLKKSNEDKRKLVDKPVEIFENKDDTQGKPEVEKKPLISEMALMQTNENMVHHPENEEIMYVIKMRIPWLENELNESELSRFLLIDFPGFEDQEHASETFQTILESSGHIIIDAIHSNKHLLMRATAKYWKHHLRVMTKVDIVNYKDFVKDEAILEEGKKIAAETGGTGSILMKLKGSEIGKNEKALQHVYVKNYKKLFQEKYGSDAPPHAFFCER
jgi:hypothetical protein